MTFGIAARIGIVLLGISPGLAGASDWEVIAERDGIVVSRRPVEGRALPQLRSVGEVPGTPYEVLAILLDVPAHVYWRPDCVESKTLRRVDTWRSVTYTRTDLPWPVSDREAVTENEVTFIDPPSKVKVTFASVTAPDVARAGDTVRMTIASGSYAIEAIDDARSLVHYEVDVDPGGSLPGWLINMQSTRNPLETLAGLRETSRRDARPVRCADRPLPLCSAGSRHPAVTGSLILRAWHAETSTRLKLGILCHGNDDLSPSVSFFHMPDRLRDFAQRVTPADDRDNLPLPA